MNNKLMKMKKAKNDLRTKSSEPWTFVGLDFYLQSFQSFQVKVKKLFDKVCQMKYIHLSIYTYIIYLHIYLFLFLSQFIV